MMADPPYTPTSSGDRDRERGPRFGGGEDFNPSTPQADPSVRTMAALFREIASLKEIIFTRLDAMDRAIVLFNENVTRVPTDTDKQISHLRELLQETFKVHDQRFDSIELQFVERDARTAQTVTDNKIAIDAALQASKDAAAAIDGKISHLQSLHDEKFRSISVQFTERDVRTEQTSRDSKTAVDAALQAAKEAVGKQNESSTQSIAKSEAGTAKQIEQMQTLLQTNTAALDGKIADKALLLNTATSALNDQITDVKGRLIRIEESRVGQVTAASTQQTSHGNMMGIIGLVVGSAIAIGSIVISVAMRPTTPSVVERVIAVPPPVVSNGNGNGQFGAQP